LFTQVKIKTIPNSVRIARLVGAAFCPDFRADLLPKHINGDKTDCRAKNLLWVPRREVTGNPYSINPKPRTEALRAGEAIEFSD